MSEKMTPEGCAAGCGYVIAFPYTFVAAVIFGYLGFLIIVVFFPHKKDNLENLHEALDNVNPAAFPCVFVLIGLTALFVLVGIPYMMATKK